MNISIFRRRFTKWGWDGSLFINGIFSAALWRTAGVVWRKVHIRLHFYRFIIKGKVLAVSCL